jgi:hypothetical protein
MAAANAELPMHELKRAREQERLQRLAAIKALNAPPTLAEQKAEAFGRLSPEDQEGTFTPNPGWKTGPGGTDHPTRNGPDGKEIWAGGQWMTPQEFNQWQLDQGDANLRRHQAIRDEGEKRDEARRLQRARQENPDVTDPDTLKLLADSYKDEDMQGGSTGNPDMDWLLENAPDHIKELVRKGVSPQEAAEARRILEGG